MAVKQWRRFRVKVGVCSVGKGSDAKVYGKLTLLGDVFESNKPMVKLFGAAKFEDLGPARNEHPEEADELEEEPIDPNWISDEELNSLTVDELRAECKKRGIRPNRSALKRDLAALISEHRDAPANMEEEDEDKELSEEERHLLDEE